MKERRKYARDVVFIPFKIDWPDKGINVASAKNYSYGGALINNPFNDVPAIGTKLTLQVTDLIEGKEAPILLVHVTRSSTAEIAVELLIDPRETEENESA